MVCVAAVTAAHGVRGALKLRCFTESPENVAAYGPLFDEAGRRLFELRVIGPTKGGVIVKAEGIDDRDAAEALRGLRLHVPRAKLPAAEEDEFYVEDLIGLETVDAEGHRLGRVVAVHDFGAGDILEYETNRGTELVPFLRAHVPAVDLEAGRIVVDPPRVLEEAS